MNKSGEIVGLNFQNILIKYQNSFGKTQKLIYSKLGFAISHEVFREVVHILFENKTDQQKYDEINGTYAMTYKGKTYFVV